MRFRPPGLGAYFLSVLLTGFVLVPTSASGAKLTCLRGTDPVVALDQDQIAAVRLRADAACDCSAFNGVDKGFKHGNYVKCAKAVIDQAINEGELRKQCKGVVKRIYAKSTCGFVPTAKGPKVPCVKKIARNGKTVCAVKPDQRCVSGSAFTQVPCPDHTFCQDAADSNGDRILDASDSGACVSLEPRHDALSLPGHTEPHTPGSGDALEFATPPNVSALLGAGADLNRVSIIRTTLPNPDDTQRRAVLIVVPGFLSGAAAFKPLARELAKALDGAVEIWAVERRPNQLEDHLGALHAQAGTIQAIEEGFQFYFADVDNLPTGNFPGAEDLDIDEDGVLDPAGSLTDRFGVTRGFLKLSQDDLRYAAYWGVDTYVRDWKLLVDLARQMVGPSGLVLVGGHSLGTTWAGIYAAYDFDPGAGVDAAYQGIDGLVLIEGGGPGSGSSPPTPAEYAATVTDLATPGGADVFLSDFNGVDIAQLGPAGEISGIAGLVDPTGPAISQRTPVFGAGTFADIFSVPATNRSIVAFFLDDDFQPTTAFRASLGFSSNGQNTFLDASPPLASFYLLGPAPGGAPRTWMTSDNPGLPTCPPNVENVSPGCAIVDNGSPATPPASPKTWGVEREVTDIDEVFRILSGGPPDFSEWYFLSGRTSLDLSFGRDSSSLGDETLLAVTQNSNVDVPILCIGGSNGLAPQAESFDGYLGSVATPPAAQRIEIIEGYAHLDPLTASDNDAVPLIADWILNLLGP